MKGAAAASFEYLGRGYARDAWHLYFEGRVVTDDFHGRAPWL